MASLNIEQAIDKAKDVEDLKIILRQIAKAINTFQETKNVIHGDLRIVDDGAGVIMKSSGNDYSMGDGNFMKLILTGTGTQKQLSLVDLGKTDPSVKGR